eukprot:246014-Pelagomonas_calceolata.AAC.1
MDTENWSLALFSLENGALTGICSSIIMAKGLRHGSGCILLSGRQNNRVSRKEKKRKTMLAKSGRVH